MSQELVPEMYEALREELEALKVEANFSINMQKLEWAHKAGETIRSYAQTENITPLLSRLAEDVGISERTLYRYVELYDKYPKLEDGINQHGKNVSMTLLLGDGKEKKEERERCTECGKLR